MNRQASTNRPEVVLCACSVDAGAHVLCKVNDTRALIGPCDLNLMPDQKPCCVQPFTKAHIVIGLSLHIYSFLHLSLEDQHMEWKPAGQPEHAILNQCQLIVANRCSGHPQQVVEIRFLCNVIDAGALIGPCSHVTSCCCLIC